MPDHFTEAQAREAYRIINSGKGKVWKPTEQELIMNRLLIEAYFNTDDKGE